MGFVCKSVHCTFCWHLAYSPVCQSGVEFLGALLYTWQAGEGLSNTVIRPAARLSDSITTFERTLQGRASEPGLLGEDASGVRYLQLGGRQHGGRLFMESPQVRAQRIDSTCAFQSGLTIKQGIEVFIAAVDLCQSNTGTT